MNQLNKQSPAIRIGVQLPILAGEGGVDGRAGPPSWDAMLAYAHRAEALGFDSLWIPDHLLFRRGGEGAPAAEGIWECWSLLAALAASTTRIGLGTLVGCTAFRHPALLARMALSAQGISGGRLLLGLGAGWHRPEFAAFGVPFDHRVGRFEEALLIIRALFASGPFTFHGDHHRIDGLLLRAPDDDPRPPPIIIGSTGPRMLSLAARHADGCNLGLVTGHCRPDAVIPFRDQVDAACRKEGRNPETLTRTVNAVVVLPELGGRPLTAGDEPLTGPPRTLAAAFRGFANEGVAHLQLLLRPNTIAALEAVAPALAILRRRRGREGVALR